MSDTIIAGGTTYTGVPNIKATDSNDNTLTFIRPSGTKSISQNGTGIDVTEYAAVDVNVSGGSVDWDGLVNGTWPTGVVTLSSSVTSIPIRKFDGFTGITGISAPGVTVVNDYAFENCKALTSIDLPEAIELKTFAFSGTNALEVAHFPKVTTLGTYMFQKATAATTALTVVLPAVTTLNTDVFRACKCAAVDLGPGLSQIRTRDFYGTNVAHFCNAIILRKTASIVTLESTTNTITFSGMTPVVYVPSALKSTYENDASWATLISNNKVTLATIEGSQYETHYADGTAIPT